MSSLQTIFDCEVFITYVHVESNLTKGSIAILSLLVAANGFV